MSQQSDMAGVVYERLKTGPVPVALLVRELRDRWGPDHGILSVHRFVSEVATCLLWRGDVEVGDLERGEFTAWRLDPDEADTKLCEELCIQEEFLYDYGRYVFRMVKNA